MYSDSGTPAGAASPNANTDRRLKREPDVSTRSRLTTHRPPRHSIHRHCETRKAAPFVPPNICNGHAPSRKGVQLKIRSPLEEDGGHRHGPNALSTKEHAFTRADHTSKQVHTHTRILLSTKSPQTVK